MACRHDCYSGLPKILEVPKKSTGTQTNSLILNRDKTDSEDDPNEYLEEVKTPDGDHEVILRRIQEEYDWDGASVEAHQGDTSDEDDPEMFQLRECKVVLHRLPTSDIEKFRRTQH
ncbi:unnamed protein product [Allacma fusca]|uniref:Uncharacterized protein n=1 Tax=Allacma fusca TaxID=39272 RepID=A0A8J2NMB3_9HEXA|nr:unnamed protein product [Allacma fusca]